MGCGKAAPEGVPSLQQPSQKILSLTLHSLERGEPRWILAARRAEVFEKKGFILGKEILVTFYEKNIPASRLAAPQGSVGLEKQEMKAEGIPMAVLFESLQRQSMLWAEELSWNPEDGKIRSQGPVRQRTPGRLLTGIGLEATEDHSTVRILENVRVEDSK